MSSRSSQRTIERLVDDLQPVRPRAAWGDGLLLAVFASAEFAIVMMMATPRADLDTAMQGPMFWWKIASCLGVAVAGAIAVVLALDPAETPRRGRQMIAGSIFAAITGAALLGWSAQPSEPLLQRLVVQDGIMCIRNVLALSLPMALAIVWVARRAAPTRPGALATVAGVAAAGWGAFIFAWLCDQADPLYVIVWYGLAVLTAAALGRWLLPRALRW